MSATFLGYLSDEDYHAFKEAQQRSVMDPTPNDDDDDKEEEIRESPQKKPEELAGEPNENDATLL